MKVADLILKILEDHGIKYVFGYPGGAAIPLFTALVNSNLQLILSRHEQGATHIADGYSRSSKGLGVVMVTSGPGATNTVTGILTSRMDSSPLLVICGQVSTKMLGTNAFQEADIISITASIVKQGYRILDPQSTQSIVEEAISCAVSGRPGPVIIDVPNDILKTTVNFFDDKNKETLTLRNFKNYSDISNLNDVTSLINNSKKPIILAGQGVIISRAHYELLTLRKCVIFS